MSMPDDPNKHDPHSLQQVVSLGDCLTDVVGVGWRLLQEGEPLQEGDGFLHPDYPGFWTDYKCRPDIFRGGGTAGTWYHVPTRDFAHTWPWRRRVGSNGKLTDCGLEHARATPKTT